MRFWTEQEVRDYLPRLRELVGTILAAANAVRRARTNGHGPPSAEVRAALDELAKEDVVLRDPSVGLVDFYARGPDGVVYYLCWRADDDDLGWWHLPEEGFAGRKPLPREPRER